MVHERVQRVGQRGFSLAEIVVAVAIIGVLLAASAPSFISYWRAAATRAAARELTSALNHGRQLAIANNGLICVLTDNATRLRFEQGPCNTGNFWRGPGTDTQGWRTISNSIQLTGPAANVVFTNLGAAVPGGQYTLRNPSDGQQLTVTVAGSGRITTP